MPGRKKFRTFDLMPPGVLISGFSNLHIPQPKIRSIAILTIVLLTATSLPGQLKENFDDGEIYSMPAWQGDTSKFKVVNGLLQSQSSKVNDKFYISTGSSRIVNTQWEFLVNLQFKTSSANYADVFICSDSAKLDGQNSGYFVRFGGTDDEIALFEKKGSIVTKIIDGKNGVTDHSNNIFKVKIACDSNRMFLLWIDTTGHGEQFELEGSAFNTNIKYTAYFGLLVRQSTAGFFYRHFFDDFYIGKILTDTIRPFVRKIEVKSKDTLKVFFSERLDPSSLDTLNLEMNDNRAAFIRYSHSDSSVIEIGLLNPLTANKYYDLQLRNYRDRHNNIMYDTAFKVRWLQIEKPAIFEVIINEIMADPDPPLSSLPGEEYVELFNSSGKVLQLENCFLGDNNSGGKLPKVILEPGGFLIVCTAGKEDLFKRLGNVVGIYGMPSLNNAGDALFLRNADGKLIHHVIYDLKSYKNPMKENGGWSLELIDVGNPCHSSNVSASINAEGGTPGTKNSIHGHHPDNERPALQSVRVKNPQKIYLVFNETLDSQKTTRVQSFSLTTVKIQDLVNHFEILEINLSSPLLPGQIYQLTMTGIYDCAGNTMPDTTIILALPEQILPGDLVINEILFNPPAGGVDFIEIYNRSGKILTFKNLTLFNHDSNNQPADITLLDTSGVLIFPGQFKVFTTDPGWLSTYYPKNDPQSFMLLKGLPAMEDKEGHIGIGETNGVIIEEFDYSEKMHLPLLTDFDGISLERISDKIRASERSNFTSAAATFGYATPGLSNSHHMDQGEPVEDWLSIEPLLFSPDEDGYNDLTGITISTPRINCQANVMIFDPHGWLVTHVVNNTWIGSRQTWFWNGMDSQNKKTGIGIYIVYAELFGPDGKMQVKKKTVTLGGR